MEVRRGIADSRMRPAAEHEDTGPPARAHGAVRLWASNPGYRSLWTARTLSQLGDALLLVALLVHLAAATDQALTVAALLLVGDFGPALLGPVTGGITDRFGAKRVMIVGDLVQAAVVLVMLVAVDLLPLLLLLVGIRALAGQTVLPASPVAVPAQVHDDDLDGANAGLGLGLNLAEVAGPVLAWLLLAPLGVRGVLLVVTAVFVVAAAAAMSLPRRRSWTPDHQPESPTTLLTSARAGLRYIWSVPLVRVVGLGFCGVVAFTGIDDVALVFLATDSLGGTSGQAGLLYAAVGFGLVVGFAVLAAPGIRLPALFLMVTGFAVSSAGNLLTGLAPAMAAVFALQAVRGLGIAAIDVGVSTAVQRTVTPGMLGRTFGTLYGAVGVAAGVSYAAGGVLLGLTSARTVFVIAGLGGLLVTALVAAALLRQRHLSGAPGPQAG